MTYSDLVDKQIIWRDPEAQLGRKQMLVFTNCTGRALCDYLRRNKEFRAAYNVEALETGPIQLALSDGKPVFQLGSIVRLFEACDVLVTNNMGPRHREMALENIRPLLRGGARTITFVAPNFSCLWPIAYGFSGTLGAEALFDKGATVDDVWAKLKDGSFDPLFDIRYRLEMGKLSDKGAYHDVDIARFIAANLRKVKLFTAGSHPTQHVVAHIGSEILRLLGMPYQGEAEILQLDAMEGTMAGWPETDYEWNHFKFAYPIKNNAKFDETYREILDNAYGWWKRGALIMPPRD